MANSQAKLMGLELVGSRLRVTTADGRYAGILHSLDLDNGRVTLEKGKKGGYRAYMTIPRKISGKPCFLFVS